RRYVREPQPLHFPSELPSFPVQEKVPESDGNFQRRVLLYALVRHEFGENALVGSDMFVYWDPSDTTRCLAPDLAVRVGTPAESLKTWKTWVHGAPHVGVEIVSDSDESEAAFRAKLGRYRQAGIGEVVRFDAHAETPLRFWDFFDGDLVERQLAEPDAFRCDALGLYWCVREEPRIGRVLRLARDAAGSELLPTPSEAEAARAANEAARAANEAARASNEAARAEAALARVAELEAELAKRR
ncbi:MAG TPA: Uma2 family endonuclease, partial [Polyangiaceae bacterium]